MNKHKRRDRRHNLPLRASLTDRMKPGALSMLITSSAPPQMPRMPSPPRSTRDVLTLLTAATGMALAAQPDCTVELLPGSPTTVLLVSGGQARAAFVLPVAHEDACVALGRPVSSPVDLVMDRLWEEQRQDDMLPPDMLEHETVEEQVA